MYNKKLVSIFMILVMIIANISCVSGATYEYDALGRLISTTYEEGKSTGYTYDAGGNVTAVAGITGESTTELPTETTTEVVVKEYVWNDTNGENTDNFFSVKANEWSSAVPIAYGDLALTKAVKMESNSSLVFNAPKAGTLKLVTYSTKAEPTVIFNGASYGVSANGVTEIEIPSEGTYTIAKGTTSTYVYYMSFGYETISTPETTHFVWNYTDSINTDNFYVITANVWNGATAVEYDGLALTKAVKMESDSKVSFTAQKAGKLTLVTYSTKASATVLINGKSYNVSSNGATEISLEAGEYNITKGTTNTYLYYIDYTEE